MISDNFVTGDHIYLRELQNFFFEVLGMMSITHYGAIGDGRFDNYGALQVAIDDANRRKLSYIYVPYGRYRYRGQLINIGDIKFVGNPHAKIFNDRTGEEIEILQFGVCTGRREEEVNVRELTADLYLVNGTVPTLEEGLYFTSIYQVYINGSVQLGKNELFYYDADKKTIAGSLVSLKYGTDTAPNMWWINLNRVIVDAVVDDPMYVPTAAAVYQAIQNITPPTMEANAITAQLEEDYEAHSDVEYAIPLVQSGTVGTGLTVENDVIVVGSGISKVKISALANVYADAAGRSQLFLIQNNNKVASATKGLEADERDTLSIPGVILDVSENDTILLKVALGNGDIVYGNSGYGLTGPAQTYITVEAIG